MYTRWAKADWTITFQIGYTAAIGDCRQRAGSSPAGIAAIPFQGESMTYYQEIKEDRDAWRQLHCYGPCMVCGKLSGMLDCHEMHSRARAPRKGGHRANYLAVCRTCHEGVVVNMPLTRQLAHKLLHDADNFDLGAMSRIVGRAILLSEVVSYLKYII